MGLLPAALLAELQRATVRCHFVLDLQLLNGTTVRLSMEPLASLSLGLYRPWITKWETSPRAISNWRGGFQASTHTIDVDDTAGQFTLLCGRKLRGTVAAARLLSPNVPAASYWPWYVGIVDAAPKRGNTTSLQLRIPDDTLGVELTRAAIRRNTFSLPGKSDALDKGMPHIIGSHDSSGFDALGMLPCYLVDDHEHRYLLALGWGYSVLRVFVSGELKSEPTDYTVREILSGDSRKVTVIEFEDASAPADGAEVLADVLDTGRTGAPASVLADVLTDLGYNDYHTTSFPTAAELDTATFTALDSLISTQLGIGRSYYIPGARKQVDQVIKEFCDSFDAFAYYTVAGKIALGHRDYRLQNDEIFIGPGSPDSTLAARRVLRRSDYLSEPQFLQDAQSVVTNLLAKWALRSSDGTYFVQRAVRVETDEPERQATLEMPWLERSAESLGATKNLQPDGTSSNTNWSVVGAASIHAGLTGAVPTAPGSTPYVESDATVQSTFRVTLGPMPDLVAVQSVQIVGWSRGSGTVVSGDDDTLTASAYVSGVGAPGPTLGGWGQTWTYRTYGTWDINHVTGQKWTQADLNGLEIVMDFLPATSGVKKVRLGPTYALITYTAAANVSPAGLLVASKRLNRYRRAPDIFSVDVPLEFADLELGDIVAVEDPREGWGTQPWERGYHMVTGIKYSPSGYRLNLTMENIRDLLTSFWLQGRALTGVDGASAAGDGMALLTLGVQVAVARAGVKNVDSPAGIDVQSAGPVVQILANCWPSERRGTLIERERVSLLLRSSFVSGLTGLTTSAGSGTIDVDTAVGEQLFVDSAVTPNVLLITAGSPHTTESRVTWPDATAPLASTFSIDYKGSSLTPGDGLVWEGIRVSDGFYWNDTTSAYQMAAHQNALPEETSWARIASKALAALGKGGLLRISLVLPSGGTAGRTARIGHVQLETGEWASSRVVTDASTLTRMADQITIGNDKSDGTTTRNTHPLKRGRMTWLLEALWSSANVASATKFWLRDLPYDSNNRWSVYYEVGAGWRFTARAGGVDYTATVDIPVVAGTRYKVDLRWTSSLGEWDKPLTLTIVVSDSTGVLGSAEAAYVAPTPVADATIYLYDSTNPTGSQFNGYIVEARVEPSPPSDAEMGL